MTSQTPSSTLHLEERAAHFINRETIKLSNNKMDSKVIKSHLYSLEESLAVSIEFNYEL